MQRSPLKWIAGVVVFVLPTIVVILSKSSGSSDIRGWYWGSFLLAGTVPPFLVLTSNAERKIVWALGLVLLLAAQFGLTLLILLAGFRS